jgi:hypothetical protein
VTCPAGPSLTVPGRRRCSLAAGPRAGHPQGRLAMARHQRRSAAPPTPRPARRPAPAGGNRDTLARTLDVGGPAARRARQQRLQAKLDAAAVEIRQRVDAGHELWQAFTGEPMPLELDEIRAAAVRFGMPAADVLRGDFTLADVTTFMLGKRQAAADDLRDRAREAATEAAVRRAAGTSPTNVPPQGSTQAEAVDDEHARIARGLSRNARRTLEYMHEMYAHSRADRLTRQFIAEEIGVELDDMRVVSTELGKTGRVLLESVDGCQGGWWLSPDGVRVAERVAATRPGSVETAAATKRA